MAVRCWTIGWLGHLRISIYNLRPAVRNSDLELPLVYCHSRLLKVFLKRASYFWVTLLASQTASGEHFLKEITFGKFSRPILSLFLLHTCFLIHFQARSRLLKILHSLRSRSKPQSRHLLLQVWHLLPNHTHLPWRHHHKDRLCPSLYHLKSNV